jgi:hypothetical protein
VATEFQTPPEAFGDRYFWPMVTLLGLGLILLLWALDVPIHPKYGGSMAFIGLLGWLRERRETARRSRA